MAGSSALDCCPSRNQRAPRRRHDHHSSHIDSIYNGTCTARRMERVAGMSGAILDMNTHGNAPVISAPPGRQWVVALESVLGKFVEVPAALLVLSDVIVLFAGIVARFVFHQPLL